MPSVQPVVSEQQILRLSGAYSTPNYFFALPRTGTPTNNRNYCASAVVIAFARLFDVRYSPELHGCYLTTAMECHAHTWKS